jgi:hypothetical protein
MKPTLKQTEPSQPQLSAKSSLTLTKPRWTQIFITNRALRKSLRAAELAWWQATGGDVLRAARAS